MRASNQLIDFIKGIEGLKLTAYKCPAGVWTIGHGHTLGVMDGDVITTEQATEMLIADLSIAESAVNKLKIQFTQGQFDALVDFVFNIGENKLRISTLLKKIRSKASDEEIQEEFKRWVYGGGKVLPGLVKRRDWDAAMWIK